MNGKKFCTLQVKGELTCVNLSLALFWQDLVVVVVTVTVNFSLVYKLFVRFIFIHSCMNCTSALVVPLLQIFFYSNLFKFGCILVVYDLTQKGNAPSFKSTALKSTFNTNSILVKSLKTFQKFQITFDKNFHSINELSLYDITPKLYHFFTNCFG